jgi:hypothetical protein
LHISGFSLIWGLPSLQAAPAYILRLACAQTTNQTAALHHASSHTAIISPLLGNNVTVLLMMLMLPCRPSMPPQVESLAQLGVQLLLFHLGRELSFKKLKSVWSVALLGGSLQIVALMVLGGMVAAAVKSNVPQGIFVGALLSMSSTSVVVKCLEAYHMTASAYGQITIGTLILQVRAGAGCQFGCCCVGVGTSRKMQLTAADGQLHAAHARHMNVKVLELSLYSAACSVWIPSGSCDLLACTVTRLGLLSCVSASMPCMLV